MESNEQNKVMNRSIGLDTWNSLTAVRNEWEGGTGQKEVKGSAKEHICVPTDTDNSQVMARGKAGAGARWRWAKQEKIGTSVIA